MAGDSPQRDRTLRVVNNKKRRRILQSMGAAGVLGLAGCLGDDDDDDTAPGDDDPGVTDDDDDDPAPGDDDDTDPTEDLPDVQTFGPDGEQVTLTLMLDPGTGDNQDIGFQIRSDLEEKLGIELEFMETANILAELDSEPLPDEDPDDFEWGPVGRNAGPPDRTRMVEDFDMLIGIGGNSRPRTPSDTETFWVRDGAVNGYGYVPEEANFVDLYAEARQTPDEERRQEIFATIFGALTVECPANFLSQGLDFTGYRDGIHLPDDIEEYGASFTQANMWRDDQSVGTDFINLGTGQSQTFYAPEADDTSSGLRIGLVTDGTYGIAPGNEIVPLHMGVEMDETSDGDVWVYTLRDNLQFGEDEDGNSFGQYTAEDHVFQLEYVHGVADDAPDQWDEEVPPSADVPNFQVVENVEQTGELEFQLELASPDPAFDLRPPMWVEECLPMGLYEKYMPDASALRQSTEIQEFTWTGNLGPYSFESRTPGVSGDFVAVRNEDYYMHDHVDDSNVQVMGEEWAQAPYFDNYVIDIEEETATVNERFRAGQGDSLGLETDVIDEFRDAVDDVFVVETPTPFISSMFFNMRSNGHDIVRTMQGRQALCNVIDKEIITGDIQRGFVEPATTWQPDWSEWYDDSEVVVRGIGITDEDIIEARELIDSIDGYDVEEV